MWRVLAALSNSGEQRQVDLAAMTSIDASTMSRLVSRLVRMGLVTRGRSRDQQPRGGGGVVAQGPRAGAAPDPDRQALEQTASAGCRPRNGGGQARAGADVRQFRGSGRRYVALDPLTPRTAVNSKPCAESGFSAGRQIDAERCAKRKGTNSGARVERRWRSWRGEVFARRGRA